MYLKHLKSEILWFSLAERKFSPKHSWRQLCGDVIDLNASPWLHKLNVAPHYLKVFLCSPILPVQTLSQLVIEKTIFQTQRERAPWLWWDGSFCQQNPHSLQKNQGLPNFGQQLQFFGRAFDTHPTKSKMTYKDLYHEHEDSLARYLEPFVFCLVLTMFGYIQI